MADEHPSPSTSTPHRYNLRNRESLATPSNSFSTRTQRRPRTSTSSAQVDTQVLPNITQWLKEDLVAECSHRGLKTGGTKAVLIARLRAHMGVAAPSPGRRPASTASDGGSVQTPLRRSRRQTTVHTDATASEAKEFETPVSRSTRARRPSERPATSRKKAAPPTRTPATRFLPRRAAAAAYRSDPPTTSDEILTPPQATARKLQLETNASAQSRPRSTRVRSKGSTATSKESDDSASPTLKGGASQTASPTRSMTRRRGPRFNRHVATTVLESTPSQPPGAAEESSLQVTARKLHLETNAPAEAESTSSRAKSNANAKKANASDHSVAPFVEDGDSETGSPTRAMTRRVISKSSKPVLVAVNNSNINPKSVGDVNLKASSDEEEQGIEKAKGKVIRSGNVTDAFSTPRESSIVGAMTIAKGGQLDESCAIDEDSVAVEASKPETYVTPDTGFELRKGAPGQPDVAMVDMPSSVNIVVAESDDKPAPDQHEMEVLAGDPIQTSKEDILQTEKVEGNDGKEVETIVKDANNAKEPGRPRTEGTDLKIEHEGEGEKEKGPAPEIPAMNVAATQNDRPLDETNAVEASASGGAALEDGGGLPDLPAISSADAMDIFESEQRYDSTDESRMKDNEVNPIISVLAISGLVSHETDHADTSDVAVTDVRPSASIIATETVAKSVREKHATAPAPLFKEDDLPAEKLDVSNEKVMSSAVENVDDAQERRVDMQRGQEDENEHGRTPMSLTAMESIFTETHKSEVDIVAANSASYVHTSGNEENLTEATEKAERVDMSMSDKSDIDVHSSVNNANAERDTKFASDQHVPQTLAINPTQTTNENDLLIEKLDADGDKVMSSVLEEADDQEQFDFPGPKYPEVQAEQTGGEEVEHKRTSKSPTPIRDAIPEIRMSGDKAREDDNIVVADSASYVHTDGKDENLVRAIEQAEQVDISMPDNIDVDVHSFVNVVSAERDMKSAPDEHAIEVGSAGPTQVLTEDNLSAGNLGGSDGKLTGLVVEDSNDAQQSGGPAAKDSEMTVEKICKNEKEQKHAPTSSPVMDLLILESNDQPGDEIGDDHVILADSASSGHSNEKKECGGKAPIFPRRILVEKNDRSTCLDAGNESVGEGLSLLKDLKQSGHDTDCRDGAAAIAARENAAENDLSAQRVVDVGDDSQSSSEGLSDQKRSPSPNGQIAEEEREEVEDAVFSGKSSSEDAGSEADRQPGSAADDRGLDSYMSYPFEGEDSAPHEEARFSPTPSVSEGVNADNIQALPNGAENAMFEVEDGSDEEVGYNGLHEGDRSDKMNDSEYSSNSEAEGNDKPSRRAGEIEVIDIDAESEEDSREEEGSKDGFERNLVEDLDGTLSAASAGDSEVARVESAEMDAPMVTATRLSGQKERRFEETPKSLAWIGTPENPAVPCPIASGDKFLSEDEIVPNGDVGEKENGASAADQGLSEGKNIIGMKRGRDPEEEYVEQLDVRDGDFQITSFAEHSAQRKRLRIEDVVTQLHHYMPTPDATIQEIVVDGSSRGQGQTENVLLPTVHADEKKRSSLLERLAKLEGETVNSSLFTPEPLATGVSPKQFSGTFHTGTNFGSSRSKRGGLLSSTIRKHSSNLRSVRPRRIQARGVWDASKLADYSSKRAAQLSAEVRKWRQAGETNKSVWSRPPLPDSDSGLMSRY